MPPGLSIHTETCQACGLCGEVCPIKIMYKDETGKMAFRQDRLTFCMRCGQCMMICPTRSFQVEGMSYAVDFFELPHKSHLEEPFFELVASRRAVRNYKKKPVPHEVLEKIVQAIAYAPPGFTPIKTEVVVVENPEVMHRALPLMIDVYDGLIKAMRNPMSSFVIRRKLGVAKFRTLEHHVVPLMENRLPELKQGIEDTITRHAPAMIVFHADANAENYEEDAYIALAYGFLAAHALGLGASAIDLIPPAIQNSPALRLLLGIPEDHVVAAAMILGYPKYHYQRAIRRELKGVTYI